MEKTYIIGFDIVEHQIVFETFASFGLKVVDYMEHTNIYHIVFVDLHTEEYSHIYLLHLPQA